MQPLLNKQLLPPFLQPKQVQFPMAAETSKAFNLTNEEESNQLYATTPNHNNRRKFSPMDDNCLILGLQEFGYKNIEAIRHHWLPYKTSNEIKHRYKNLTC